VHFIQARVQGADGTTDQAELEGVSWIAASRDDTVLGGVVLPALLKSGGSTENGQAVAEMAARVAVNEPRVAAQALVLLVGGDRWQALPRIAREPIRRGLELALGSADDAARALAAEAVHVLGAQGFHEFRDLLGDA
jgi:hypothetical protein